MYYLEQRLIMRNIGRQRGEPHYSADDWETVDYGYPSKDEALRDMVEATAGSAPDDSFCRFEIRVKFVSE